jgi:SAM-dependent methyltransferase
MNEPATADLDYFQRGGIENQIFWERMGERPDFQNSTVLDVGCGVGRMCVDIALAGASKVVGLDTDARLIGFANENLARAYTQLMGKVEFLALDLKDYHRQLFDCIISKDSFEHIMDLKGMLAQMRQHLKPGGRIFAGFGPLYNSPFGHHGRIHTFLPWRQFPWAHLVESEARLMERINRHRVRGENVFAYKPGELTSIRDLGLNKMSLREYREAFRQSGLDMVSFQVNRSTNLLSRLASLLKHVPFLEEYFTHTVYCIMERPQGERVGEPAREQVAVLQTRVAA